MTYSTAKFKVATSNGLEGDTFTRNVTDGQTHGRTDGRTDGRRTDFDTKLIYPFFLKKKAGITRGSFATISDGRCGLIDWLAFYLMRRLELADRWKWVGYCFFCCYFRLLHDSLATESGCSGNDGAGKLFWGMKNFSSCCFLVAIKFF